jgi:hypothetical protein
MSIRKVVETFRNWNENIIKLIMWSIKKNRDALMNKIFIEIGSLTDYWLRLDSYDHIGDHDQRLIFCWEKFKYETPNLQIFHEWTLSYALKKLYTPYSNCTWRNFRLNNKVELFRVWLLILSYHFIFDPII